MEESSENLPMFSEETHSFYLTPDEEFFLSGFSRHPQKDGIRFNEKLFKFVEAGFVGRLSESCFLFSLLLRTF